MTVITKNKIKSIFDSIREKSIFSDDEKEKYNELIYKCKNNKSEYLFIDDEMESKCECLNYDEMFEKYKSGIYQAQIKDLEYNLEENAFYDFCIYVEIRVLKFLGKELQEVNDFIQFRYTNNKII